MTWTWASHAMNRATASGTTGPCSSWPGPTVPWGSTSWWSTTTLRSPRWPVRRKVGSRASAASDAMRTSPSAQLTWRASTGVSSSDPRSLRSRNSASRPAVIPNRSTAPSSAGRQNSPLVQPSRPSRTRHMRSGSGRSVDPSGCSGSDRSSRSSWEINNVGATAAISASRAAGTRRAMRTMASSVNRPAANRAKHSGSSSTRRAMRTSPRPARAIRRPSTTPSARANGYPRPPSHRPRAAKRRRRPDGPPPRSPHPSPRPRSPRPPATPPAAAPARAARHPTAPAAGRPRTCTNRNDEV